MDHFSARAVDTTSLLSFPAGDNSTDTVINGVHYNLTTLDHWYYNYYSNGTISNGSSCFLVFEPYTPSLLQDGTFLNSTSCYSPIKPMGTRAKFGLVFACFFATSVICSLYNLQKHRKRSLRDLRRAPVGKTLEWNWLLIVAACAIISGFMSIDIDRYYLSQLPLVISNIFWLLMQPATMSIIFESVRTWGKWQRRQRVDETYELGPDDGRSNREIGLLMGFYMCIFFNALMNGIRPWDKIELQHDADQTRLSAEPAATNLLSKLAALVLFASWLVTAFTLHHYIKYYGPRSSNILASASGLFHYIPLKFIVSLALSLVMIGYEAASSFEFSISPLNNQTNLGLMYGLGWAPILLIVATYELAGFTEPNEDKELRRLRSARSKELRNLRPVVRN